MGCLDTISTSPWSINTPLLGRRAQHQLIIPLRSSIEIKPRHLRKLTMFNLWHVLVKLLHRGYIETPESTTFVLIEAINIQTITITALHWLSGGKRKSKRQRATWRRTIESEMKAMQHSWGSLRRLSQNRHKWRDFTAAPDTAGCKVS